MTIITFITRKNNHGTFFCKEDPRIKPDNAMTLSKQNTPPSYCWGYRQEGTVVVNPAEWLVELWEVLWSGQERGVQAGVSQGGGVSGGGTTLANFWRNDKYTKREKFIPLHSYWVITRGLRRKKKCKWLGKLLGLLPAAKQHYLQETGRDRFPASSPSTENSDSPPVPTGNRKTPQSKETCTKHAFKVHHLKSPGNLKLLPCYCFGKLQQTLPDEL